MAPTSSTRPGHAPVDAAEEIGRVIPVLAAVRDALPATPLSIDTTKSVVAEAALAAGADLLNDIWGTGPDPGLTELAATHRVPLIVMYNRAEARYDRGLLTIEIPVAVKAEEAQPVPIEIRRQA